MEFVPMKAEHALRLNNLIGVHAEVNITDEIARSVEASGEAVTAMDGDEVLGIAGISEKWAGTGVAWAWLSRRWKRHARAITQEIIRNLEKTKYPRVELAVRVDFPAGHRWAKMLGFRMETPFAPKYGPDGNDYSIYTKVRGFS